MPSISGYPVSEKMMKQMMGDALAKQVDSQIMRLTEKESDFATWVEDLLSRFGFQVAHFRPAKTEKGWRTAVSCDGKGFPDYVAVKEGRCLVIEIKSETGKVTLEQRVWLDLFSQVEVVETYLLRPSDREEFEQIVLLGHVPNLIERQEFKSSWLNRRH